MPLPTSNFPFILITCHRPLPLLFSPFEWEIPGELLLQMGNNNNNNRELKEERELIMAKKTNFGLEWKLCRKSKNKWKEGMQWNEMERVGKLLLLIHSKNAVWVMLVLVALFVCLFVYLFDIWRGICSSCGWMNNEWMDGQQPSLANKHTRKTDELMNWMIGDDWRNKQWCREREDTGGDKAQLLEAKMIGTRERRQTNRASGGADQQVVDGWMIRGKRQTGRRKSERIILIRLSIIFFVQIFFCGTRMNELNLRGDGMDIHSNDERNMNERTDWEWMEGERRRRWQTGKYIA